MAQQVFAESLLNVNLDEPGIYDNVEASITSQNANHNIRPISYKRAGYFLPDQDRVRLPSEIDPLDDGGLWQVSFPNSLRTRVLYTNEERSFLEGQSGLQLRNGANLLAFEDGYVNYSDEIILYLQLKQVVNEKTSQNQLFRGYLKFVGEKWALELGKDNVSIGPGEYGGGALSSNVEPYPLVKLSTEEPLYFLGDWDFILMNAWLTGQRNDYSSPQLLVGAFSYKPIEWAELGLVRTTLYGGDGQPGFSLDEYPRLFFGTNAQSANKFGQDFGHFEWSISVYLPFNDWFDDINTVKLYYEETGTDVNTFWQSGYSNNAPRPNFIVFNKSSFMQGIYVATENNVFRLERARITTNFYDHGQFTDGYQYNGMSLGYPYGTNAESYLFKHLHYFSKDLWGQYKLGTYDSPAFHTEVPGETMTRTFLEVQGEKKMGKYRIGGFARLDMTRNYDETIAANPIAFISERSVTTENKTFVTVGVSATIDF